MAGRYVAGKIAITGLDEVVKELEKRGADVIAGVESICMAGAVVVRDEIAGRAPDIEVVAETMQRRATAVTVGVGPTKKTTNRARWREFGTRPHVIPKVRKKGRKVLLLPDGGFRWSVNHPGSKARPFIRPGYDGSTGEATAAMGRKTKSVINA
jgi:HK97 gp10 family phage protein